VTQMEDIHNHKREIFAKNCKWFKQIIFSFQLNLRGSAGEFLYTDFNISSFGEADGGEIYFSHYSKKKWSNITFRDYLH
jgi:hypothetical protein